MDARGGEIIHASATCRLRDASPGYVKSSRRSSCQRGSLAPAIGKEIIYSRICHNASRVSILTRSEAIFFRLDFAGPDVKFLSQSRSSIALPDVIAAVMLYWSQLPTVTPRLAFPPQLVVFRSQRN